MCSLLHICDCGDMVDRPGLWPVLCLRSRRRRRSARFRDAFASRAVRSDPYVCGFRPLAQRIVRASLHAHTHTRTRRVFGVPRVRCSRTTQNGGVRQCGRETRFCGEQRACDSSCIQLRERSRTHARAFAGRFCLRLVAASARCRLFGTARTSVATNTPSYRTHVPLPHA